MNNEEVLFNDTELDLFYKEVRKITDRIYKAIEENKGVRLSAEELQYLSVTIFADEQDEHWRPK